MLNGRGHFPECTILAYVAGGAIGSGDVVDYGPRYGIAQKDAESGEAVALHTQGEFDLPKGTGYTLSQGQRWTWDGTKVVAWTPSSATKCGGIITKAAGSNDTVVRVMLGDIPPRVFASEHTVTGGEASANSGDGQVDIDTGFVAAPGAVIVQVRTATTGVIKSGYAVTKLGSDDAGKVRIAGVGGGTKVGEGDVISIIAYE